RLMRLAAGLLALLVLAPLVLGGPAWAAGEDNDLDLLPPVTQAPAAPAPVATGAGRLFLEDTGSLIGLRRNLVVHFPGRPLDWSERLSLDGRQRWNLADGLEASLSDRFSLSAQSHVDISSHQTWHNDFREGFLTWEPVPAGYLEAGRINLRNGVAL